MVICLTIFPIDSGSALAKRITLMKISVAARIGITKRPILFSREAFFFFTSTTGLEIFLISTVSSVLLPATLSR